MIDDDVAREMNFRVLLETTFASTAIQDIRETRIMCLVAETVFGVWLGFISPQSASKHTAYIRLCPWETSSFLYGGANCSIPLKQLFHDPTGEALALNPDELVKRETELRHKRREAWTNDDNWELALKQQELRINRTERERAVQRERARVSDLKHAPRRLAEQKAKNQLIKLGVTLPAKPPRIPHSGNVESWPTFYRDLLEKTEKEKAEARKKKKALKAKRAALRRRMECEYCGSNDHEFFWCIRRRRDATELAIYRKERVSPDDRVLALHELPDITEDQLAAFDDPYY